LHYGYPLERATNMGVAETRRFLDAHTLPEQVIFLCFSERSYQVYQETVKRLVGS